MERKEKLYGIEEVLDKVLFIPKKDGKNHMVDFDGTLINMASDRYKCFKIHGITCYQCGIEGRFFAMERHPENGPQYHFNLYGYNLNGNEVILTKDHMIPISEGGKDHIDNYQTLCFKCNVKKGNIIKVA